MAAQYFGPFCPSVHTAGDSDGVPAKVILLEMSYVSNWKSGNYLEKIGKKHGNRLKSNLKKVIIFFTARRS